MHSGEIPVAPSSLFSTEQNNFVDIQVDNHSGKHHHHSKSSHSHSDHGHGHHDHDHDHDHDHQEHGHSHSHSDSSHSHSHGAHHEPEVYNYASKASAYDPNNVGVRVRGSAAVQSPLFRAVEPNYDNIDSGQKSKLIDFSIFKQIWDDDSGKQNAVYLVLRIIFTIVALITGSYADSVGLVCLAFHSLFESVALGVELWARTAHKYTHSDFGFSYGLKRFEVLSAFGNAVFLIFVSIFTLENALERIFEPPHISHGPVMTIAVSSFILNLIGFIIMQISRTESTPALQGEILWTRLIADNISSIGVIFSTFMVQYGYHEADPLVAIVISIAVIYTTIPLSKDTAKILLLSTPSDRKGTLYNCVREAQALEGVLECNNEHFWTLANNHVVGSIHVRVNNEADEQVVLKKILTIFRNHTSTFTVQIEKDKSIYH